MIRLNRIAAVATMTAVMACAAGAVQAQPQGSPTGAQQPDLSSMLHLRSDQQNALKTYQAATQANQADRSQAQSLSPQALAAITTPARLDRIATFLKLQQSRFQHNADATRAFYAQLTPDQQRTFDQITAPPTQARRSPQG